MKRGMTMERARKRPGWRAGLMMLLIPMAGLSESSNSHTNWPYNEEWRSLKLHLEACYEAVLARCVAADIPTNDFHRPGLLIPMFDYMRLARKIDEICPRYVDTRKQGSDGTFNEYFMGYHDQSRFPRWTPSGLHEAAGFGRWATNGLHSWALCDRSIQTQINAAVACLKYTVSEAEPVEAATNDNLIVWSGYGSHIYSFRGEVDPYNPNIPWPYAKADTAYKPEFHNPGFPLHFPSICASNMATPWWSYPGTNIQAMYGFSPPEPYRSFFGYYWNATNQFGWSGYVRQDHRPGWDHQFRIWMSGLITAVPWSWFIPQIDVHPKIIRDGDTLIDRNWQITSTPRTDTATTVPIGVDWSPQPVEHIVERNSNYEGPWVQWTLSFISRREIGNAQNTAKESLEYMKQNMDWGFNALNIINSIQYVAPRYIAQRCRSRIVNSTPVTTNYPSRKFLYAKGEFPGGMIDEAREELSPTGYGWSVSEPESVQRLQKWCFAEIWQGVWGSKPQEYFANWSVTNMPIVEAAQQMGWGVADACWLIEWKFPAIRDVVAFAVPFARDTDRDDLIDIGFDAAALKARSGRMGFDPDRPGVIVTVPIVTPPAWLAGPGIHACLWQGAFDYLPFQYLAMPEHRYHAWTAVGLAELAGDDDGPYQAYSLNTRILETVISRDPTNRFKRVSLLRPNGVVVAFEFEPLDGDTFKAVGYPVGVHSNRTYVLRDPIDDAPFEWIGEQYALCFESGVIHHYGHHRWGTGTSSMVNAGGWLAAVEGPDGRRTEVLSFGRTDIPDALDWAVRLPGMRSGWFLASQEWTLSQMAHAVEGASDGRFNVTWERNRGLITRVDYETKDRQEIIGTALNYVNGWITALSKTGMAEIENVNARILEGGTTIAEGTSEYDGYARLVSRTESRTGQGENNRLSVCITETFPELRQAPVIHAYTYDARDRLVSEIMALEGEMAETVYHYKPGTGRHENGFRRDTKISRIQHPQGNWETFDYDPVTGWLTMENRPVSGLDDGQPCQETTWFAYSPVPGSGGDSPDTNRPLERPRTVTVARNGMVTARTLYAYEGVTRERMQRCLAANAGWNAPGNQQTEVQFRYQERDLQLLIREPERALYGGLVERRIDPLHTTAYAWTLSTVMEPIGISWDFVCPRTLTSTCQDSDGTTEETVWGMDGTVLSKTMREDGHLIEAVVTEVDSFGRPTERIHHDGLEERFDQYGIFGARHYWNNREGRQYLGLYRNGMTYESYSEVSGILWVYTLDSMGRRVRELRANLDTMQSETVRQARYDVLGRETWSSNLLGQSTAVYSTLMDGVQETLRTRTGRGPEYLLHGADGRMLAQWGDGVAAPVGNRYGVDPEGFWTETVARNRSGTAMGEWSRTRHDRLGRVVGTEHPNDRGQVVSTRTDYDLISRPFRFVDASGITRLQSYNPKHRVEHAGVKVEGSADSLEAAGKDRFNTHAESLTDAFRRMETYVYPEEGNANRLMRFATESSHDGRTNRVEDAGRVSETVRKDGVEPGIWTVTTERGDGTRVVREYERNRLACVKEYARAGGIPTLAEQESYRYDWRGRLERISNSRTGDTVIEYDTVGRIESIRPPDIAKRVTFEYHEGTSWITAVRRADGKTVRKRYLPTGLVEWESGVEGGERWYAYDDQGRLKTLTTLREGRRIVTRWNYNRWTGRLESKQGGEVEGGVPGDELERYTYRDNGQLAAVRHAGGLVMSNRFDAAGGVNATLFNDGASGITATMNRLGQMDGLNVQGGVSTRYQYGVDGQLIRREMQGNGLISNSVVTYRYAVEHPEVRSLTVWADGWGSNTTVMSYDARVRLARLSNAWLCVDYAYPSNANWVTNISVQVNGAPVYTRAMEWDYRNERLTQIRDSHGINGRMEQRYVYAPHSDQVVTSTLPGDVTWSYRYDEQDRLLEAQRMLTSGDEAAEIYGYEFDEIGNAVRAGRVETNQPVNAFESNDMNLHVRRVWHHSVEIVGEAASNAVVTVNDIRADRQGSRFSVRLPVVDYPHASVVTVQVYAVYNDGTNDVVAYAGGWIQLPGKDEAVTHTPRGMLETESRYGYRWDGWGRLLALTNVAGNWRMDFAYDGEGCRIRKQEWELESGSWILRREYGWVYAGRRPVMERIREIKPDGERVEYRDYVWGLDLDGIRSGKWGESAGGIGGLLAIRVRADGQTNCYLPVSDRQGTVRWLLDGGNGQVVAWYDYEPFGILKAEYGPARDACSFRFMTKPYDADLGFYDYGIRWYDPRTMKWLSNDPKQEAGGYNLSGFCNNDPINNVDAWGLAFYAFGGTHNSLDDDGWSNVEILYRAWDNDAGHGEKFYVPGVYSGYAPDNTPYTVKQKAGLLGEGIWGTTLEERADYMIGLLETQLKAGDKEVNITGFSRGSLTALVFLNKIADQVKAKNSLYAGVEINQTILFDTVAATKENFPHDLPSNLNYIYQPIHLIALDEQRTAFFDKDVLDVQGSLQIGFRGVHANVGGGQNNNSLSREPLEFVREMMEKSGMKVFDYASMWKDMDRFGMMQGVSTPSHNDKPYYFMGHRIFPEGMFLSAGFQINRHQLKNSIPGSLQYFNSEDQRSWLNRARHVPGTGWMK